MLEGTYGLYNRSLTDEEVEFAYEYKHGSKPEVIVDTAGGKLAGPIPTEDQRDREVAS